MEQDYLQGKSRLVLNIDVIIACARCIDTRQWRLIQQADLWALHRPPEPLIAYPMENRWSIIERSRWLAVTNISAAGLVDCRWIGYIESSDLGLVIFVVRPPDSMRGIFGLLVVYRPEIRRSIIPQETKQIAFFYMWDSNQSKATIAYSMSSQCGRGLMKTAKRTLPHRHEQSWDWYGYLLWEIYSCSSKTSSDVFAGLLWLDLILLSKRLMSKINQGLLS